MSVNSMKGHWVTIDPNSIEVDERGHEGPHRPAPTKHWPPYCGRCGLVFLRNEVTQRAIKLGCSYKRDMNYIAFCKRIWGLNSNSK